MCFLRCLMENKRAFLPWSLREFFISLAGFLLYICHFFYSNLFCNYEYLGNSNINFKIKEIKLDKNTFM